MQLFPLDLGFISFVVYILTEFNVQNEAYFVFLIVAYFFLHVPFWNSSPIGPGPQKIGIQTPPLVVKDKMKHLGISFPP